MKRVIEADYTTPPATNDILKFNGTEWAPSAGGGGTYTDEEAQDAVGTILTDSTDIDFSYNDATPSITADLKKTAITGKVNVTAESGDKILVADVSDSENLKYVTAGSIAALASGVSDGDKGDITVSGSGSTFTIDGRVVTGAKIGLNTILTENIADAQVSTAKIVDEAVNFAKMQNITTNKLLGRGTALTGDIEEITLGTNLSFTGTTLNAAGGSGLTQPEVMARISMGF